MKITIFNVGHGASVLIELPQTNPSHKPIGIVDCFWGKKDENQLFRRLVELEQEYLGNLDIKFFVITHLHKDHFFGVGAILRKFGNKIQRFCDPGLSSKEIVVAEFPLPEKVHNHARDDIKEIQNFKDHYPDKIFPLVMPNISIYEDKSNALIVKSVAPNNAMLEDVKKHLSTVFRKAKEAKRKNESIEMAIKKASQKYDLNRTSSAIQISYNGKNVILGGDVLRSVWESVLNSGVEMRSDIFLLSHHGASNAFPENHWDRFHNEKMNIVISADGKSHPDPEVLKFLSSYSEEIWLTNLPEISSEDELHTWTVSLHYNAKKSSGLRQGNVQCSVNKNVEVFGPRLKQNFRDKSDLDSVTPFI